MKRWMKRVLFSAVMVPLVLTLYLYTTLPEVCCWQATNPTTTAFMKLRGAKQHDWKPLHQISPYLIQTFINTEDPGFFNHWGFSWTKFEAALRYDWSYKQYIYGGSTITQQLAKNLYLSPCKTLWRKLKELSIAFALEWHLSKERILELYLNVIEMGPGIFGVEAGSLYWFGCHASELTPRQAVNLALIASAPRSRDPSKPAPFFEALCNRFLIYLAKDDLITYEELIKSSYMPATVTVVAEPLKLE